MGKGIGLGVGINRSNYARGIFGAYRTRVVADGGIVEAGVCVDAVSSLLQTASLLLIPSGYKSGVAYSEIPTNGNGDLTWSRASTGYRTNASGIIEEVAWNLLTYTEEFDQSVWTKTGCTISTNVTTAPNGTLTADKLLSTNLATSCTINNAINVLASTTYNYSIYVKASGANWVQLIATGTTITSPARVWINLSNGTLGTNNGGFLGASVTNVGDGWYRVNAYFTTTGTSTSLYCTLATGDNINGFSGDGTSGAFIWGAQLVAGTDAKTYLPVGSTRNNYPRLSYMYGSCPALLAEPQRTNFGTNSQNFADASWATLGGSTKGATNLTDPANTNTACNVTWSAGTSTKYFYNTRSATVGTCTISFYVKSSSGSKFRIYDGVTASISSDFTATSTFQRYSYTFTQPTSAGGFYGILSGSDNSAGDVIIAFAQFEQGAYPTTYIPTTTASATRVADSASKTGISSLIGQSAGTLFASIIAQPNTLYIPNVLIRSAFDNIISIGFIDNKIRLTYRVNTGSLSALFTTTTVYSTGTLVKVAIKYTSTSYNIFINGVSVSSGSITMPSSFDTISLNGDGAFLSIGTVFNQQIATFTTALSDAQCTTLTT